MALNQNIKTARLILNQILNVNVRKCPPKETPSSQPFLVSGIHSHTSFSRHEVSPEELHEPAIPFWFAVSAVMVTLHLVVMKS